MDSKLWWFILVLAAAFDGSNSAFSIRQLQSPGETAASIWKSRDDPESKDYRTNPDRLHIYSKNHHRGTSDSLGNYKNDGSIISKYDEPVVDRDSRKYSSEYKSIGGYDGYSDGNSDGDKGSGYKHHYKYGYHHGHGYHHHQHAHNGDNAHAVGDDHDYHGYHRLRHNYNHEGAEHIPRGNDYDHSDCDYHDDIGPCEYGSRHQNTGSGYYDFNDGYDDRKGYSGDDGHYDHHENHYRSTENHFHTSANYGDNNPGVHSRRNYPGQSGNHSGNEYLSNYRYHRG